MKQVFLFITITISSVLAAQNVGIGTTNPQTRLHILSSGDEAVRVDGSNNPYVSLYSAGIYKGYFWKSPSSIEIGSAVGSGLPITFAPNGDRLMYIGTDGKIGMGTSAPRAHLSLSSGLGQKISFYDDGNAGGVNYGIGLQSALLQLYTDGAGSHIAFGHGSSASFNERMRLVNSGETGIELKGRIYLKNGTSPVDINHGSGVWLYKADNSGLLGFMGTQNNQNIGFYGGPAGWGFTYDAINSRVGIGNPLPNAPLSFPAALGKKITLYPGGSGDAGFAVAGNRLQIYSDNPNADVAIGYDAAGTFNERFAIKPNGALALNGNTGTPGLVLQSNGGGGGASWVSPTNSLYNNTNIVTTTSLLLVSSANPPTLIPGLSHTFSVSGNAKVLVSFTIHINSISCGFCGTSDMMLDLTLNGGNAGVFSSEIGNGMQIAMSGNQLLSVGPGTYTLQLLADNFGPDLQVYQNSPFITSNMIVQVIPQ